MQCTPKKHTNGQLASAAKQINPAYVEFLEEENRTLKAILSGSDEEIILPPGVHLTARQLQVISTIVARKGDVASKAMIHQALYSDRPDGGPTLLVIDVLISQIRKRVAGAFDIETLHGRGYRISRDDIAKLAGELPW
jgi:DNA-binding response OmpR family regulator